MKTNPVGWFEIYVNDIERAKTFYEATFNLSLEKLESPKEEIEMWAFPMMGPETPGAAGAICKMPGVEPKTGGTLVYFSCDDCATEATRASENGGQIFHEKFSIGQYGFIAVVGDTEGNTIGLHSMV